jgi:hypothetical protein
MDIGDISMAILHLNLTEDHLKLVRFLNIEDKDDDVLTINKKVMLTMQTHILDDVAMILGLRDKAIKGTEEDSDGGAYRDDVEKYMLDTYNYVSENLYLIESLLHQRILEGVQQGHYKCRDNDMVWEKCDE